jgi:hypothetical protein
MLLNCNSRWRVSEPPRSLRSRLPLTRGDYFTLPLVRGRAAEGGRGSLTQYLEIGLKALG